MNLCHMNRRPTGGVNRRGQPASTDSCPTAPSFHAPVMNSQRASPETPAAGAWQARRAGFSRREQPTAPSFHAPVMNSRRASPETPVCRRGHGRTPGSGSNQPDRARLVAAESPMVGTQQQRPAVGRQLNRNHRRAPPTATVPVLGGTFDPGGTSGDR